ncbi:MAG: hypothetical protein IKV26_03465 [Paludibacteraceae bacterium]|nr:hypothetical protein [Paludibacteraceae bacterium]
MEEFFKSLKDDIERAYALWIINNIDLIRVCVEIKYTILSYLQIGLYCLILPYRFVELFVQNMKKHSK